MPWLQLRDKDNERYRACQNKRLHLNAASHCLNTFLRLNSIALPTLCSPGLGAYPTGIAHREKRHSVYVCMYACMYVCMYLRTYLMSYPHQSMCVCVCENLCMYVRTTYLQPIQPRNTQAGSSSASKEILSLLRNP
jgi:hypothetical protein